MVQSFLVVQPDPEIPARFAFLHGPIGITEGGTLLPELLVTVLVLALVIWQYRRRRHKR